MSRKWYLLGDQGRSWLKRMGEASADLQEGDRATASSSSSCTAR